MVSDEIGIMEKGGIPADAKLPTDQGDFRIRVFHDLRVVSIMWH